MQAPKAVEADPREPKVAYRRAQDACLLDDKDPMTFFHLSDAVTFLDPPLAKSHPGPARQPASAACTPSGYVVSPKQSFFFVAVFLF